MTDNFAKAREILKGFDWIEEKAPTLVDDISRALEAEYQRGLKNGRQKPTCNFEETIGGFHGE